MSLKSMLAAAVCLTICSGAPGDSNNLSYDQAAAALQELLNSAEVSSDTHTPSKLTVAIVASETGAISITQTAQREQPDLFFRSSTQQTWTLRASDIDPKRVESRTEPLSVYAPIKKDRRLIQVSRTETKSRLEGGHEPAEDWEQRDAFMTSFVSIPVATVDTSEKAANLLRQIAKSAPETESR